MKKFFFLSAVLMASQLHAQQIRLKNDDLKELAARMTGIFTNAEQAAKDAGYPGMVMHVTPLWLNKKDGFWFYVEESRTTNLSGPSKQKVYHIYRQDNHTLAAGVYELKKPGDYIGAWKDETKLYQLTEEGLTATHECTIFLYKNSDGNYTGSTSGKGCLNSSGGATYTTSEISVYNDRLISWDRGWDAGGKQIWGAEKGGYIFIKSKD